MLLTTPLTQISAKLIGKIFENTELKGHEKEKLKLEVEELRKKVLKEADDIGNNNLIKKKSSISTKLWRNILK